VRPELLSLTCQGDRTGGRREVVLELLSCSTQARCTSRGGVESGLAQLEKQGPEVGEGGEDAFPNLFAEPWLSWLFPEPPATTGQAQQLPRSTTTSPGYQNPGRNSSQRRSARGRRRKWVRSSVNGGATGGRSAGDDWQELLTGRLNRTNSKETSAVTMRPAEALLGRPHPAAAICRPMGVAGGWHRSSPAAGRFAARWDLPTVLDRGPLEAEGGALAQADAAGLMRR